MGSFAEEMRAAIKAKEQAEGELAEAVARSALGDGEGSSSYLESSRAALAAAEERVSGFIEEASEYAERALEATEKVEALGKEVEAMRAARDFAEAEAAKYRSLAEEARHGEAMARSESAAHEKARTDATARQTEASTTAQRLASDLEASESALAAAEAAGAAAEARTERERAALEAELARARDAAEAAERAVAESQRAAELELGEARRDSEVHRERRLAARTELLSVAKALEASRAEARDVEQAAKDQLVPRLLRHCTLVAGLVQRALALGKLAGADEQTLRATRDRRGAKPENDASSSLPGKYLGDLAQEINRLESGFDLLAQSLDVLEDALEAKVSSRGWCVNLFKVVGLGAARPAADAKQDTNARRRIRFAPSIASPRAKAGYSRVRLGAGSVDDDDDDHIAL